LAGGCTPIAAQRESAGSSAQLLVQSWAAGSENRQQVITAMLQTREGYLWIGTNKGLVRFDGVRFTDFPYTTTPGMSHGGTNFAAIWEDTSGGVWAGTQAGATHYDGARFSSLTREDGLPSNSVVRVDGDGGGAVWLFTAKGVCRWNKGKLDFVHPELEDGTEGRLVAGHANIAGEMAHLGLWRLCAHNHLQRFAYGQWSDFPFPTGNLLNGQPMIRSIYQDSLRRVWYSLLSAPGKYYEVATDHSFVEYSGLPAAAFVFFRDRDGFLWLTDHQAHTARWKNGRLYSTQSFKTPYLTHMIENADGGLWAGTMYSKLFLFRHRVVAAIEMPGAPEVGSLLFRQKDGSTWAAGTDVVRFQNGEHAIVASMGEPPRWGIAASIGEDRYGNLLLGDRSCQGVRTLKGNKVVASPLYSAVTGVVQAILLDAAGGEWFGTTTGLFHAPAGKIVGFALAGFDVSSLPESAPGHLWIGTGKGPALMSDGRVEKLPDDLHWTFGAVTSLSQDPQGAVWLSTLHNGVVHYVDGKFRKFDQSDGLPTDAIYSIDATDERYLWLRTDGGLLRIDKQSLPDHSPQGKLELKIAQFDETDGLPSIGMGYGGNQGILRFADGRMWASSIGGIAEINPAALDQAPSHLHAVIEEHAIDASGLRSSSPNGIVMRPNQTSLEIRYTALGSLRPEHVKFRYQLKGIDDGWIPAGQRREAFYAHLPPGAYTFRVQAADQDEDAWSSPAANIALTVLTPFYRSWWMKVIAVLIFVAVAAIVLHMRRRRMMETQRLRQAFTHRLIASQESERKRIAHELHDGLGQHLALIRTLALLPAQIRTAQPHQRPAEQADSDSLTRIADQAAIAIHEVEAISYDLRPYQLDRLGLTKAVRSLIRQLEEGNALILRSSVEDIDGFFPPELGINFYRIVQEGISNILKHSEATEAEIRITNNGTHLHLFIEDNGCGFSPGNRENARESLGLIGIAERAEVLGGRAVIESSERAGTRVIVDVTRTPQVDTRHND
jgi:signal transduction histidine kinase/ligand-binding sensor domain-containing protein